MVTEVVLKIRDPVYVVDCKLLHAFQYRVRRELSTVN